MSRIVAILNCLAPNGANKGQLTLRADGSVQLYGCPALVKASLLTLGVAFSPALTRALAPCEAPSSHPSHGSHSSPPSRKRIPKASSYGASLAAAAE